MAHRPDGNEPTSPNVDGQSCRQWHFLVNICCFVTAKVLKISLITKFSMSYNSSNSRYIKNGKKYVIKENIIP